MASPYAVDAVELRMEVDAVVGTAVQAVELPVVRFSAAFAPNEIPRATATIAAGRNLRTFDPSPVHTAFLDQLREKRRARVYARVTPQARQGVDFIEELPAGWFLVFDGYTTAVGFRTPGGEFTVGLEHWLSDLAYASAISATSHPANPGSFIFAANHPDETGDADQAGYLLASSVAGGFIDPTVLQDDFWSWTPPPGTDTRDIPAGESYFAELRGVRAWFRHLCQADALDSRAGLIGVPELADVGAGDRQNLAALDALARFEPDAAGAYRCGVPLRLDTEGSPDLDVVGFTIANSLSYESPLTMANTTLWDRLLEYAQTFLFTVVPQVEGALVVPFTPGLRTPWKTIRAAEYEASGWAYDLPRLVRGVGIYGGRGFDGGADLGTGGGADTADAGIGGYYLDPDKAGGLFLILRAPPWMCDLPFQAFTPAAVGGVAEVASATHPGASPPPTDAPAAATRALVPFQTKYARGLYVQESLKGRSVDLTGRLRFDIAPGSVVGIEATAEALTPGDALGEGFFGTVRQVTIDIDAETPRAATSFRIADLRTATQNATGRVTLDRHPLWLDAWAGAPLVAPLSCPPG